MTFSKVFAQATAANTAAVARRPLRSRKAGAVAALPVFAARHAARLAYRVVCAWCPTVLVEGALDAPVSHGICPECSEQLFPVSDQRAGIAAGF